MQWKSQLKPILIFSLIITLLLNTTACFKRVPVPLESIEFDKEDVIYVLSQTGLEYKLKNPRLEHELLVGDAKKGLIKIPLNEVQTIQIIRPDKKKTFIRGLIVVTVLSVAAAIAVAPLYGLGEE